MKDIKLARNDAFNSTEHEEMVPEPEEGERNVCMLLGMAICYGP